MTPVSPARSRIIRARRLLQSLRQCAQRQSADGERCLQLLESAGLVAWLAHTGNFALPFAEDLLRQHRGFTDGTEARDIVRKMEGRTLHVVSEAYATGGHTRLAKRWMEILRDEPHGVALVRQRSAFDPAWLIPEGVDVPLADLERICSGSRRRKVSQLKAMFRAARRVILHIHPDDACAVAAAYRSPGADIRFLNHADHVAWLGAGLPVSFLNLRPRSTRLATARRGIAPACCGEVPIPITKPATPDREEARRQLGLRTRDRLILTIASAYKFAPVEGRSLLEPLQRLLQQRDVKLIAVGVDACNPVFGPLAERNPGQVFCAGIIPQPLLHRAAADLYLDSYPFGSITSMLESAVMGTPVVAYQPDAAELEILYNECPWLPYDAYAAADPDSFANLAEAILRDPARRQELAQLNRTGSSVHLPDLWQVSLRRYLATEIRSIPWTGSSQRPQQSLLDIVLAGLLQDVADYARTPEALGLDSTGCLQVRAQRWTRRI